MALSNSRIASSLGGQQSRPRSTLGQPIASTTDLPGRVQQGFGQASQTASRIQQTGGSTQVSQTTDPGPTASGALAAGVAGVSAGITLSGAGAGIAAANVAAGGGMAGAGAGLMAIGPVGWAIGAVALGAYLFS